jgi:hypothetical protein
LLRTVDFYSCERLSAFLRELFETIEVSISCQAVLFRSFRGRLNSLSAVYLVMLEDQPGELKLCSESIALRKISKIDQREIARAAKARRR